MPKRCAGAYDMLMQVNFHVISQFDQHILYIYDDVTFEWIIKLNACDIHSIR